MHWLLGMFVLVITSFSVPVITYKISRCYICLLIQSFFRMDKIVILIIVFTFIPSLVFTSIFFRYLFICCRIAVFYCVIYFYDNKTSKLYGFILHQFEGLYCF